MAVEAICKSIAEVVNQHAIPRLLKLNGMKVGTTPELRYSEVSSIDLTEISEYVSKLIGSGALTPDTELEEYLRGLAGLPMPSEDNDTEIETPEAQGDGEAEDEGLEMGEPSESENDM
jgi:hypothetical protein